MDTDPEPGFDDIVQLASFICKVPIALVSLVDDRRAFLKARLGLGDVCEVDKENTFCKHAIAGDSLMVIPNALEDERFMHNPLVAGEPRLRFYAGAPLITPAGYRLGTLCVLDMVPRELELEQRRALVQLSRQVSAQLELRLSIAAVRRKNEQLAKLSEEKSRFLSTISHDIRQPLSTVMMCSELMLNDDETVLADPHAQLANTSYSCAQFMHNLVDELLQMIEYDFGKVPVPLDCRMTDLVDLVYRVVATNSIYARRKRIALRMGVDVTPTSSPVREVRSSTSGGGRGGGEITSALVRASEALRPVVSYDEWQLHRGVRDRINCNIDPVKIEQVLNNFISNAIKTQTSHQLVVFKFSHPDSCVDIVVGRTEVDDDEEDCRMKGMRCATVSVIDRGQGIPREELGKLFQPFQRLSVRPTAGETSTGLGLAITRSIIWAHAGDVQVESEHGRGSTFRMLLPLPTRCTLIEQSKSPQQQQQNRRPSPTGFTRRPQAKTPFNVLVADDNAINLRLLTQILQRQGHAVWTAKDGQEALDRFLEFGAHEHFHILLLDEEMPHMCGAELIGHIRQHEAEHSLPRIPLVSVSGHADSEHKRAIQEAGADDVCPKPFNADRLLDVVERLASRFYLDRLADQTGCGGGRALC